MIRVQKDAAFIFALHREPLPCSVGGRVESYAECDVVIRPIAVVIVSFLYVPDTDRKRICEIFSHPCTVITSEDTRFVRTISPPLAHPVRRQRMKRKRGSINLRVVHFSLPLTYVRNQYIWEKKTMISINKERQS